MPRKKKITKLGVIWFKKIIVIKDKIKAKNDSFRKIYYFNFTHLSFDFQGVSKYAELY